jgi:hypothetical protein
MLRQALLHPEAGQAQRRDLVRGMFGETLDGYCALRVADCLIRLAELRARRPNRARISEHA